MTAEEVIDNVANGLVAEIKALEVERPVNAWKWTSNQSGGMQLPAAVVQVPTIDRSGLDEAEDHLGARDLRLEFEVATFFSRGETEVSYAEAIEVVSALIDALDANPGLSGTAQEAKVTHTEPKDYEDQKGRPVFVFVSTVEVLAFL